MEKDKKPGLSEGQTELPGSESIALMPVGIVCSEIKSPILRADRDGLSLEEQENNIKQHHNKIKQMISEIIINPALVNLLYGIEGFSHILVLYWPHLVEPERRKLQKVHPMGRKDIPEQGIFATCSPARPNPVLVSAVELLECKGNRLKVKGLEAVDNSPVIDIKPYNPGYYRVEKPVVPGWMKQIQEDSI